VPTSPAGSISGPHTCSWDCSPPLPTPIQPSCCSWRNHSGWRDEIQCMSASHVHTDHTVDTSSPPVSSQPVTTGFSPNTSLILGSLRPRLLSLLCSQITRCLSRIRPSEPVCQPDILVICLSALPPDPGHSSCSLLVSLPLPCLKCRCLPGLSPGSLLSSLLTHPRYEFPAAA
jgi:hypothetical protein